MHLINCPRGHLLSPVCASAGSPIKNVTFYRSAVWWIMKYVFTQSPRSQSSWPMARSPEPQVQSPVKANPDRNKTGHSAKLFPPEPRAPRRTLTVSSCLKKELGKNLARAPAFGSFLMKNKHISRTQNEKARLPCHKSQLWVWSVSVVRSP